MSLDVESSTDVWCLNNPVLLTSDEFLDWKVQLLERKNLKVRVLNIPIAEEVVSRGVQDHYHDMVHDKVQEFYKLEHDHHVDIHGATANITPRGTATEIHHDSDPHISTTCGPSDAKPGQPMMLWLLWTASENRKLSACYSSTATALQRLGPCGFLIQRSGESLMLPANVPHAALSLTSHFLYGQTFHVQSRAKDPTTFGLELSACTKPGEAIEKVLSCFREGLQDPDPRIRRIHIDRFMCTMSAERVVTHQIGREPYMKRLIGVLKDYRMGEGSCGLCEYFWFDSQSQEDCWETHPFDSKQRLTAAPRRHPHARKKSSTTSGPANTSFIFSERSSASIGLK